MQSPEAGLIAIAAGRYKFTQPGIKQQAIEGLRGAGSQAFASHIWGMNNAAYLTAADVWPLNPKGEICMGFKLENRIAAENCEELMAIPGLAFAEPGPSDNSWSIVGWEAAVPANREAAQKATGTPRLVEALERIRMAAKKNNIQWLGTGSPGSSLVQSYDQGMRMLPAPSEQAAREVREHSRRKMPV
jgi:4-hydroxy-2-oxoheptanedioate aldolase